MKRYLAILVAVVLMLGMVPAMAEDAVTEIPREESLVFNGQQWGTPVTFNPFAMTNQAFPVSAQNTNRFPIYEALYMYNMLTNENEPFLADGPIEWEDAYNIIVRLKENVHFSDGEAMTADDVVFTYNIANDEADGFYTGWTDVWSYLEKIEKVDDYTVRLTITEEPYNMHMLPSMLSSVRIIPEHVWQPLIDDAAGDFEAVRQMFNEDPIGTGAYKLYFWDETRIVCIRDDSYWGQAENMFGKLSEVKYLVHPIYQDNAAGNLAFSQGEVDVSQQFLPNVWELQESMDAPVTTYLEEAPYHLGASIPSLIFSLERDGLNDSVVRKAVALCLDYEAINVNAMSGYSEPLIYCLFNAYLFGDYVDFDDESLQDLMWDTTDLDANLAEANRILDEAGYLDIDGDGMREMPDGSKIEWKAEAPTGWTDWTMTLEILAESAKKIGLNIVTYFPEASVFWDDLYPGNFDIIMYTPYPPLSVAMPWQAAYNVLYSRGVPPIGENTSRNFNRFTNDRVDELIDLAAATDDIDELIEYYTEINKIWLEELPTVLLMYRPQVFHTTYEGYWTGFAKKDDGKNTPPMDCTDGAGIKDLYNITPVAR